MSWWRRRPVDEPPISKEDTVRRRACASEARREIEALEQEVPARDSAVRSVSSRWADLRAHNHYGDLITSALRGRES